MKNIKNWVVVMCLLITFSMIALTACSSDSNQTSGVNSESQSDTPVEPIELTLFWKMGNNDPVSENHPIVNEVAKNTGVKLIYQNVPWNSYYDKLNLAVNTGEMADILMTPGPSYELASTWVEQGVFMELDELLKSAPNVMNTIPSDMWNIMKKDGKTYWIPRLIFSAVHVFHIREDWLKDLNIEAPKNLEELYDVGKAFRDNYPDSYALGSFGGSGLFWIRFMSTAYDLPLDQYKMIDGELKFCNAVPEAKTWVEYANKLYSEGILDPEFSILAPSDARGKMYKGQLGMIGMPANDTVAANKSFEEAGVDGNFQIYAPPKGEDGVGGFTTFTGVKGTIGYWMTAALSSTCKDPEAAIKVIDYLYSEEGSELVMLGRKGVEYNKNDDEIVYLKDDAEYTKLNLRSQNLAFVSGDALLELSATGSKEFSDRLIEISEDCIYDDFILQVPNSERISELGAQLGSFSHEQLVRFIVGSRPLSEFNDYCQEWLDRGGEELLAEIEKELNK